MKATQAICHPEGGTTEGSIQRLSSGWWNRLDPSLSLRMTRLTAVID